MSWFIAIQEHGDPAKRRVEKYARVCMFMHLTALRTTIGRRLRERTYAHRGVGALGARCFLVVCLGSVAPAVLGSVRQSGEDDIDRALGGIRPWLCGIVHLVLALQLSL